jgi:hypothetical protein
MKTHRQITQILLEKGVEDVALLEELDRIMPLLGSSRFYREFPMLVALRQLLRRETEEE